MCEECRLHVVGNRDDFLLIQEAHDAVDRLERFRLVLFRRTRGHHRWQVAVALLLEFQRGPCPVEFPFQQAHLVVPGQRHEVYVLLVPGVVVFANAGWASLCRRLGLQPLGEFERGCMSARNFRPKVVAGIFARHLFQSFEILQVLAHVTDTCYPQVARIAREVLPRLLHQRRDHFDFADQALFFFLREREFVGPDLDDGMMSRSFVCRHVAPVHPNGVVERGITFPGLQYAAIEVVTVHLGANEMPVNLFGDRPAADVEVVEPRTQLQVIRLPRFEAFGRVIRCAIEQRRRFEDAPVLE